MKGLSLQEYIRERSACCVRCGRIHSEFRGCRDHDRPEAVRPPSVEELTREFLRAVEDAR